MVVFGVKCTVTKRGRRDVYGQESPGESFTEKCAVVKLKEVSKHTTVRVDSGATRAAADEMTLDAVLLMMRDTKVEVDDFVDIAGASRMRVISKRPRYSVGGKLDHLEVGCEID